MEICENERHEIPGSKGEANFIMKWAKDDRKHCTISIEHVKNYTRAYGGSSPYSDEPTSSHKRFLSDPFPCYP